MKYFQSSIVLFLLLFFFSCNSDDHIDISQASDLQAYVIRNESYGAHNQQNMDVYLPAGRSMHRTPVMLVIHGGGWTGGDKADMTPLVNVLSQRFPDMAILNVNYVLGTENHYAFPNQFYDMNLIMNHIRDHSQEWQISSNYFLLGVSAGAHIASLYSYSQNLPQITGICNIVGPVDFTDPYYAQNPLYQGLLNFLIDPNSIPNDVSPSVYISPVTHAHIGRTPTISFFGDADPLVPISQKERLEAALAQHNILHHSYSYHGDHSGIANAQNFPVFLDRLEDFINHLDILP
ncbi:MAG: alpha/beta hydrolase [Flavobacteriaceae bacterium]|nr:alpha/beta hydrolase [Flavobacteriaceae bacterium]